MTKAEQEEVWVGVGGGEWGSDDKAGFGAGEGEGRITEQRDDSRVETTEERGDNRVAAR